MKPNLQVDEEIAVEDHLEWVKTEKELTENLNELLQLLKQEDLSETGFEHIEEIDRLERLNKLRVGVRNMVINLRLAQDATASLGKSQGKSQRTE